MVRVERFPEAVAATVHPTGFHDAIGSAGAGKALNLARLGVDVTLIAGIGDDLAGSRVREGLVDGGVRLLDAVDAGGTAEHLNLMDPSGARISLLLRNGSADLAFDADAVATAMAAADVVVVDLAPWTPRILPIAHATGRPVWTDLHDYDDASDWHRAFIEAADVVFASADRLEDPAAFLAAMVERGKRFSVVTLGRDGAIAMDVSGRRCEVPAISGTIVVDANGAGDAFFAGTLFGMLDGLPLERALRFGSIAGGLAVGSTELASPSLSADRLRAIADAS
jgi:sugar/nucleoside kinase (ribokinase family)